MSMPEAGDTTEPQGQNEEQVPVQGQSPRTASEGRRGGLFSRALESAGSFLRRLRGEQQGQDELQVTGADASQTGQVSQQTVKERMELDRQLFGELRQLTQLKKRGDAAAGQFNDRGGEQALQVLTDAFKQRVLEVKEIPDNGSYREVYEFEKQVKSWEDAAKIDPSWQADLDALFSKPDRDVLSVRLKEIDTYFKRKYDEMDDSVRESLFGDLERELQNGIDALRLGQTINDIEVMMFGGRDRYGRDDIGAVVRSLHKEPENISGILEWRATKSIDGVETRVGIELLTQPPARWEEVPQKLANIYRFIESTDFTVEQLTNSIQQAVNMIQTVERNHPEGRALLAQLNKELKAFQAFHMFRVTMEREHQNPEAADGVFKNFFDDDTWKSFAERFSRDNRGREFVRLETEMEDGKLKFKTKKEGGLDEYIEKEPLNIFEVAKGIYFEKLKEERKEMNLVEALTAVGIEHKLGWKEHGAIEMILRKKLTDQQKEKLEDLRKTFLNGKEVPERNLRTGEELKDEHGNPITKLRYKVDPKLWGVMYDDKGKALDVTRLAVREWYKNETLLGATDMLNVQRGELRKELAKRLVSLGVKDPERLGVEDSERKVRPVEIDNLINSGYLESVDYNAYNFVWTMAWSDFDIIRVYGKQAAGKLDPMISQVVYNERSSLYTGRIIDHPWEFLAEEQRGRPGKEYEANAIIRRMYPGRHHGLFERNRTMVRFFDNFTTDEQKQELGIKERDKDYWKKHGIKDRVQELMDKYDFSHPDPQEREWFRSWAEGIVKGEIIDNGEVNFGKKDFSEEAIPSAQYFMSDLYSDRAFTVKYLNKENFQGYLADPTTENFRRINRKATAYYSGRNIRLWPWMTLATRAHWEFNSKHARKLFERPNMTAASGEKLIDDLVDDGDMEKKQGTHEKRRNFGFYYIGGRIKIGEWVISEKEHKLVLGEFFGMQPFRKTRQTLERLRRMGWDARWLWLFMLVAGAGEGLKTFGKDLPKRTLET